MRISEVAGDLNALHWALYHLAYAHLIKGEWSAYSALADRALAINEQRGNPGPFSELLSVRSRAAFFMGDWAGARSEAERTRVYAEQFEDPYAANLAVLPLARLALAEGQWDLAAQRCAEALTLAQGSGRIFEQREAYEVLAELDLRAGRAREAYTRLAPIHDDPGVEERGVTPLLVLLAWAHLELGENEVAQEVIATATRRLRADDDRLGLVDALRVQAMVQTRCGRAIEAAASLEEGLALAGAMPYPYAEARLLHAYGQLHAQKEEPAPARERLEAALAIFRRLGAHGDARRVEQELREIERLVLPRHPDA
jgi:ATP/maltotriose-dependent transcriptional regulator MalT